MGGPRDYYTKWNKPVRERQIPHDFTSMWNLVNKINWQKIETEDEHMEQTAVQGDGGGRSRWKKVKGLAEKHKKVVCVIIITNT